MHAAPPVSFPAGRSRTAGFLLAALSAAALATACAWAAAVPQGGWRQAAAFVAWAAAFVAWAAASLAAWRGWLDSATGTLRWDGAAWLWSGDGPDEAGGTPAIALDLQACMLLRWRAESGRGRWLWVDRGASPREWPALRRAVYSRARTEAPDGAKPPMAQR